MRFPKSEIGIGFVFSICIILLFLQYLFRTTYKTSALLSNEARVESVVSLPTVTHINPPMAVKAIYMTACVAGTPSWRSDLAKFIEISELNSVVIDIKDYSGSVSFEKAANCF